MNTNLTTNEVKTDPMAGLESNMRALTDEEMETASGGAWLGVAIFAGMTAWELAQLIHNSKKSTSRPPAGGFGSDVRIKEDIEKVGFDPTNKVEIYSWRYKNEDQTRYVGVMAQDILARKDLAGSVGVATNGPFEGFYAVDYNKLGLKMTTEQNWNENGLASVCAA